MPKIVCFHLFNDYSGSPKVLHGILDRMIRQGLEVELVTSRGGVLDSLQAPNLTHRRYSYQFSRKGWLTMLRYAKIQLMTFLMAWRYIFKKDTVFYINTILPVGPAIAGRMMGRRVVYHYHEDANVKSSIYRLLARAMQILANEIICVSNYQASGLQRKERVTVVPNLLDDDFLTKLSPDTEAAFSRRNVLMLSSLKTYKGTAEFLKLADALPQFRFTLVINDLQEAIEAWLEKENISPGANVRIFPRTEDVASFYNSASIVVNLSNPRLFIETFGLTALEAMACALPVIVPPVGGIAELVENDYNGYKIDCNDTNTLFTTITAMLTDKRLYMRLAANAKATSLNFNNTDTINSIISILLND